jgi:S-methylmethionine-dependent homocysteine/selenocysteine methylase
MKAISTRLSEEPVLLLDGAMGTELFRRGIRTRLPCWSAHALIENPQIVREIHEDYIRAGSEIITTNTFRTTSRALGKGGLSQGAKELTYLAVNLAKQAREKYANKPVWIAGSVAPLEDCYEPGLTPDSETAFREHEEFIAWLAEAGVDLILIETMNTIHEAAAAARAAKKTGIPMIISWTCASDGKILNGQSVREGILSLEEYGPTAFLVNCTPSKNIGSALRQMRDASKVPIGAYANIGKPEPVFGWELTRDLDPSAYARKAEEWIRLGAKIVGGCCGTTPEHISAIKNRFILDQR